MNIMQICLSQGRHRSIDNIKLCPEHSLCKECFDQLTQTQIEQSHKCNLCRTEVRILKMKNTMSQCSCCKRYLKILTDCNNHKICESCVKYPNSDLLAIVEGCPNCDNFLLKHCSNCFHKFDLSEKTNESICSYKHRYCICCFLSASLKEKVNLCQMCRDWLIEINNESNNYPGLKEEKSQIEIQNLNKSPNHPDASYSKAHLSHQVSHKEQKSLKDYTINQEKSYYSDTRSVNKYQSTTPFKVCSYCNLNEEILQCGHPKCLRRLLQIFQNSITNFAQILTSYKFSTLENDNYSIRCYEPQCSNLYCYPAFMFFEEGAKVFENNFHGYGVLMMNHYEAFFEGSKYKFFSCDNCKAFIGLTSFNPYCLYCKMRYQIQE